MTGVSSGPAAWPRRSSQSPAAGASGAVPQGALPGAAICSIACAGGGGERAPPCSRTRQPGRRNTATGVLQSRLCSGTMTVAK